MRSPNATEKALAPKKKQQCVCFFFLAPQVLLLPAHLTDYRGTWKVDAGRLVGHGRLEPSGKLLGRGAGALYLCWQGMKQTHTVHVCQCGVRLTSSAQAGKEQHGINIIRIQHLHIFSNHPVYFVCTGPRTSNDTQMKIQHISIVNCRKHYSAPTKGFLISINWLISVIYTPEQ